MESVSFPMAYTFVFCVTLSHYALLSRADTEEQRTPVVQTKHGAVIGKTVSLPYGKSVHEYLGIPYAEPPVGELRFAPPKPSLPWSGTKDTSKYGAMCPQPSLLHVKTRHEDMSEDCLFLNVFVPTTIKTNDTAAVMVWIHGGAFSWGTSTFYPSDILAAFNDVIVVTINYRLGVLGFFNVPGTDVKGNYGMLDQVLALKWIQANIENFGGDPNRVTIFGESAGAMSVSLHLVSPMSKGLFNKAIMQSGASSTPVCCGKVTDTKQLELFSIAVNCSMQPSLTECVARVPSEDILSAQNDLSFIKYSGRQDIAVPIVDGEFLPDLPENLFRAVKFHDNVDVITGFNTNEGSQFAALMPLDLIKDGIDREFFESRVKNRIYTREKNDIIDDLILFQYTNHSDPNNKIFRRHLMMDLESHAIFDAPALLEAVSLAKGGRRPYVYVFDHRAIYTALPDWFTGVTHAMDLPFVFGAPFRESVAGLEPFTSKVAPKFSNIEKGMSLQVMKLWTDFAKYGYITRKRYIYIMSNSGFQLAWWIFLICGSAVICQDCPNEAISIRCDAQVGVSEIRETSWKAVGFKHRLAFCKGHQCIVTQKSSKPHGIQVLSIERGTLTLKRTSWKSTRRPVEFMCTVRAENSFSLLRSFITVDFSVECIWSHVGAVENVTHHLVDILPWELVYVVELFDNLKLTENKIAGCNSRDGCYVTSENLKPRSALADRLQAKQRSILLSPIRCSDDGLKIPVAVKYFADFETSSGKVHANAFPRGFTLKIRLKNDKEKGLQEKCL